ncbi:MAG: cytochrome C oxidase subunit IV family protein [Bacteroidetes bacterium]|nr:cytochrome C oxidase subunit IV family protein [Bacteroidota bacterium]
MSIDETSNVVVQPVNKEKVRRIVRVAVILGIVTTFEFVVAFNMHSGPLRTSIFILMTIVKAFYIVSEFMHLKYEKKVLIWTIMIPTIFVIWLIIALIYEGGAIYDSRF